MISVIITFIATLIALLFYIVYSFRGPLIFICIVILTIMFIKIYNESKKYGFRSLFKAFKKQNCEIEDLKLAEFMVTQNKGLYITYRLENKISVCITQSGVYLIKILDYIGNIKGKEKDQSLVLQNELTLSIPNFFLELKELENDLKKENQDLVIKKIIVKKETSIILSPYSREYLVLGFRNLYYVFKNLDKKKIYTVEQVNYLSSIIQKKVSNFVKFEENTCQEQKTKLQSK